VKDFGAIGDGETDDTAAIQSAILALENSSNHNTLHFPAGTYRLNSFVYESQPNFGWNHMLKLGNSELDGRDFFFTGTPTSKLLSTVTEDRAHMLMVRMRFRSLTFRGLNWAKIAKALPETRGEPNQAGGVMILSADLRQTDSVEFDRCTFDNCHPAVELFGQGYDLRGKLGRFEFVRCGVTNRYGPNTTNSWLGYGGGQQVRVSPWVGRAIYRDNYFDGGSDSPEFETNPGGRKKDGSHFGSPLELLFTNNIVLRMEAEGVHQYDDNFMATTATPFVIPPADGRPVQFAVSQVPSRFGAGQLLTCRFWFHVGAEATNVLFNVISFDPTNRVITATNAGLSPQAVVGLTAPLDSPIYLSDYNPTHVEISGNLIVSTGDLTTLNGITANAAGRIYGNTIIGCQHGIFNYEPVRNPLNPPTTGLVMDSNFVITQSTSSWPYYAVGILSYGPSERIVRNFIASPLSFRTRGIVCRYSNGWVEGNTVIAQSFTPNGYDSNLRGIGISFSAGSTNGVAANNCTRGFDVGVGPEGPYQLVPHRVLDHHSLDDVLPVDPAGLLP
jgi:hypothetical protein